ncbi:hypothetical protein H2198_008169 [Neophaeococcomyces mojaviensis]|uniref:Uncharacterized protein n=1 Tax=Neophaeococcomyces mojaviensis TaxID=3383035 RepID=A0ACC2ZY55_9EURO|nr:hypothetical protein H2198_008169 [Knufia sp. JES_112]
MSSNILTPILSCLGISCKPRSVAQNNTYTSKARYVDSPIDEKSAAETENAANDFLNTLLSAEDLSSPQIRSKLQGAITIASLKEYFAKLVLSGLETAIRNGIVVGKAMRDALERATVEATEFAHDHPVYFTLIALGVLVIMAPTILEWLGFAELGPIEGSFAALWQARYAGYVPKGSLFSFFQRLGMIWGR